ncbi:hypothetical protein MKZ38_008125 [Zalerion maritima]|uniref:Xylanolytic transcriptional activator regulatory domain-containing protein n=1 Tax=Zalerion maritima TaxID=339359 RepID=A0AAD5WNT0_9PEZI|nr:hypothetical protein MKZ38_008125 [Zalerion maritima]
MVSRRTSRWSQLPSPSPKTQRCWNEAQKSDSNFVAQVLTLVAKTVFSETRVFAIARAPDSASREIDEYPPPSPASIMGTEAVNMTTAEVCGRAIRDSRRRWNLDLEIAKWVAKRDGTRSAQMSGMFDSKPDSGTARLCRVDGLVVESNIGHVPVQLLSATASAAVLLTQDTAGSGGGGYLIGGSGLATPLPAERFNACLGEGASCTPWPGQALLLLATKFLAFWRATPHAPTEHNNVYIPPFRKLQQRGCSIVGDSAARAASKSHIDKKQDCLYWLPGPKEAMRWRATDLLVVPQEERGPHVDGVPLFPVPPPPAPNLSIPWPVPQPIPNAVPQSAEQATGESRFGACVNVPQSGPQHASDWFSSMGIESSTSFSFPPAFSHVAPPMANRRPPARQDQTSRQVPPDEASSLPRLDKLMELIDLFFDRFYPYLPFLHRRTFTSTVAQMGHSYHCPLLLYSVIALSSSSHPDPKIQSSQEHWYKEAKGRYTASNHRPLMPLPTLQAAACIILQATIMGDHATAWLVMGNAWRQCTLLGLSQLDSGFLISIPGLAAPPTGNWRELEERRRTLWTLFILDRGMHFPIGLPHVFDERRYKVNLPSLTDAEFQEGELPPDDSAVVEYTRNLPRLVSLVEARMRQHSLNTFHYIIISYILVGRIMDHICTTDLDAEERKAKQDELELTLERLRLTIPRAATSLAWAHHSDFTDVVWLNCMLNTATVLFYHRPEECGKPLDLSGKLESRWPHCVTASKQSIELIRDAARTSTELLTNPHIFAPLFACGRILVIEYILPSQARTVPEASSHEPTVRNVNPEELRTQSPSSSQVPTHFRDVWIKRDLEILFPVFDRASESVDAIGKRFKKALLFHLRQDQDEIASLKAGGSHCLLWNSLKWSKINDEEMIQGIQF